MKFRKIYSILVIVLLSSCSPTFNQDKWKMEGKEYERIDLTEILCNQLSFGDKMEVIHRLLGQPNIQCDSSNTLFGTFQKEIPFKNGNPDLISDNANDYNRITKTLCSDTILVDRYIIGFNGSGPDYMLLCYNNESNLTKILFERTEF